MIEKTCPTCTKLFYVKHRRNRQVFCCRKCVNKGRQRTQEWKDLISKRNSGENNPFFGKKHKEETRKLISQMKIGKSWNLIMGEKLARTRRSEQAAKFSGSGNPFFERSHTQESREKISANHASMSGSNNPMHGKGYKLIGEKNGSWLGGVTLEKDPYHGSFTDQLKTEIRHRDKFKCKVCDRNGFVVHHIDYDKKNSDVKNLITLCHSCHGKTNHNREAWIRYFNV